MTSREAITAVDLVKTYHYYRKEPGLRGSFKALFHREMQETRAVDGISFSIEEGELVGFLGANGAGKTTTLKLLCGLLHPSEGHVQVLGFTPAQRAHSFLHQIALVMGQKNMLWWDLPAMETLLLHREMYRVPAALFRRTVDELADLLEVGHLLRVQVRKLSLGERTKLELLASLVHRPRLLFLDEPTLGLDVLAQQRVREFLLRLNREHGTTILLTSHDMDDIEQLCPRVLLIDRGRLYYDGGLSALVAEAAPHKLIRVVYAEPLASASATALADLPYVTRPDVSDLSAQERSLVRLSVPREHVADVSALLLRLGQVKDLSIEEVAVQEIIRGLFRERTSRTAGGATVSPSDREEVPT